MRYGFGGLIPGSKRVRGTQQPRYDLAVWVLVLPLLVSPAIGLHAEDHAAIVFTQSAAEVAVFDFIEVTAKLPAAVAPNPFTDASIAGDFEPAGSAEQIAVDGFCDSPDGTPYRIRFMPSKSGSYTFHVTFKSGAVAQAYSGTFTAVDQRRRGPLRVDPAYPWHFVWEGTGEHYFFNGTTAYWLVRRADHSIQHRPAGRAQGQSHAGVPRRSRECLFWRACDGWPKLDRLPDALAGGKNG